MDAAKMLDAFRSAEFILPQEAIFWCRANRADSVPAMLRELEKAAAPGDVTDADADALFFTVLMLGELREKSALAPLCLLARDNEKCERILGDATTELLPHMLTALAGADLTPFQTVIEDGDIDEFLRTAFLDAYAAVVLADEALHMQGRDYLAGLYETLEPRGACYLWVRWAELMILFAPDATMPMIRELYRNEWIDEGYVALHELEEDHKRATTDRDGAIAKFVGAFAPCDDILAQLSKWHAFSPEAAKRRSQAAEAELSALPRLGAPDPAFPAENPYRGIGRNDPCPCGSGKKFKKCCIGKPWELI